MDDFIHRLMTTFEANSGMVMPPNMDGAEADPYESHLCGHIFKVLRPDIAAEVKRSYVRGEDEPRLVKIRRHARHAQKRLDVKKTAKKEKQSTDLHNAALTLGGAGQQSNGEGRRRRGGDNRWRMWRDGRNSDRCYFCGGAGHWKKDHPDRRLKKAEGAEESRHRSGAD